MAPEQQLGRGFWGCRSCQDEVAAHSSSGKRIWAKMARFGRFWADFPKIFPFAMKVRDAPEIKRGMRWWGNGVSDVGGPTCGHLCSRFGCHLGVKPRRLLRRRRMVRNDRLDRNEQCFARKMEKMGKFLPRGAFSVAALDCRWHICLLPVES